MQWFKDIHARVFGAYGMGFIRVTPGYYGGMQIGIDESEFAAQVNAAVDAGEGLTEDDFPSGFFTSLSNVKSGAINVVTDVIWNGTVLQKKVRKITISNGLITNIGNETTGTIDTPTVVTWS